MLTFGKIAVPSAPLSNIYFVEFVRRICTPTEHRQTVRWRPEFPDPVMRTLGLKLPHLPGQTDLIRLLGARRPIDGHPWSARRRVVSALDLTLHPEKSVTLAATFAPTKSEGEAIRNCVHHANDAAMHVLANSLGWARKGKSGKGGADAGSTGWMSIERDTGCPALQVENRSGNRKVVVFPKVGDPHLCIHNILFNVVVTPDGRVGSLDTRRLTRPLIHFIGAYFQAELAQKLRGLGIRVGYHPNFAAATLPAVDPAAVTLFSKRHATIKRTAEHLAGRMALRWDCLDARRQQSIRNIAALATRLGRVSSKGDLTRWREEALTIDWQHKSVFENVFQPEIGNAARIAQALAWATSRIAAENVAKVPLSRDWLRVFAVRALIGTGFSKPSDIEQISDVLEAVQNKVA